MTEDGSQDIATAGGASDENSRVETPPPSYVDSQAHFSLAMVDLPNSEVPTTLPPQSDLQTHYSIANVNLPNSGVATTLPPYSDSQTQYSFATIEQTFGDGRGGSIVQLPTDSVLTKARRLLLGPNAGHTRETKLLSGLEKYFPPKPPPGSRLPGFLVTKMLNPDLERMTPKERDRWLELHNGVSEKGDLNWNKATIGGVAKTLLNNQKGIKDTSKPSAGESLHEAKQWQSILDSIEISWTIDGPSHGEGAHGDKNSVLVHFRELKADDDEDSMAKLRSSLPPQTVRSLTGLFVMHEESDDYSSVAVSDDGSE